MTEVKEILNDLREEMMEHCMFDDDLYDSHDIDALIVEEDSQTASLVSWVWRLDKAISLLEGQK